MASATTSSTPSTIVATIHNARNDLVDSYTNRFITVFDMQASDRDHVMLTDDLFATYMNSTILVRTRLPFTCATLTSFMCTYLVLH